MKRFCEIIDSLSGALPHPLPDGVTIRSIRRARNRARALETFTRNTRSLGYRRLLQRLRRTDPTVTGVRIVA